MCLNIAEGQVRAQVDKGMFIFAASSLHLCGCFGLNPCKPSSTLRTGGPNRNNQSPKRPPMPQHIHHQEGISDRRRLRCYSYHRSLSHQLPGLALQIASRQAYAQSPKVQSFSFRTHMDCVHMDSLMKCFFQPWFPANPPQQRHGHILQPLDSFAGAVVLQDRKCQRSSFLLSTPCGVLTSALCFVSPPFLCGVRGKPKGKPKS